MFCKCFWSGQFYRYFTFECGGKGRGAGSEVFITSVGFVETSFIIIFVDNLPGIAATSNAKTLPAIHHDRNILASAKTSNSLVAFVSVCTRPTTNGKRVGWVGTDGEELSVCMCVCLCESELFIVPIEWSMRRMGKRRKQEINSNSFICLEHKRLYSVQQRNMYANGEQNVFFLSSQSSAVWLNHVRRSPFGFAVCEIDFSTFFRTFHSFGSNFGWPVVVVVGCCVDANIFASQMNGYLMIPQWFSHFILSFGCSFWVKRSAIVFVANWIETEISAKEYQSIWSAPRITNSLRAIEWYRVRDRGRGRNVWQFQRINSQKASIALFMLRTEFIRLFLIEINDSVSSIYLFIHSFLRFSLFRRQFNMVFRISRRQWRTTQNENCLQLEHIQEQSK